ncbi:DUF4012 domain-containing protein [Arthrobacter sp. 35W]|uniref:DUF4012 domain-containing protein n=1 Tax=Arthrobacter sp. 35W TaxID=1132441 RepID=UPI0009DFB21F|nr:DUF4012 domain-containing protein [Arthrobacter sp. 35W]
MTLVDPSEESNLPDSPSTTRRRTEQIARRRSRRRFRLSLGTLSAAALLIIIGSTAWLGFRAGQIKDQLEATTQLLPQLQTELISNNHDGSLATLDSLREHTASARSAGTDPVWKAASSLPWIGPNLSAVSEVAITADDIVNLAAAPMVGALDSLDWKALTPANGAISLEPLKKATPSVIAAANTVQLSYDRLADIDSGVLLPQIAAPLDSARVELDSVRQILNTASTAAQLVPTMMGSDGTRNYLLLVQNNAEIRATGGIPGALAVIQADNGKIKLLGQGSATALGQFKPPLPVDEAQEAIYTNRLGMYMQDVNLTPDYPTAARTAQAMWEQRNPGHTIDGVISLDPVALALLLQATGPVDVSTSLTQSLAKAGLPTRLTSDNTVQTLLSDVYSKIKEPVAQDAYFAEVAQQVFAAVSSGQGSGEDLMTKLADGVEENRILVWSAHPPEQQILQSQPIGGAISGPSVAPASFAVYFNDGTGAKMDYYVKRTVQLVRRCDDGGYAQYTSRITLTNTAPEDAATSLPEYVTGGGAFGVEPGHVATNIVAYGPTLARVHQARLDGATIGVGSYKHADRPVGVVRVDLAPGQSTTVEVDFSKVVQSSEPQLAVTPTVQSLANVVLPPETTSACSTDNRKK